MDNKMDNKRPRFDLEILECASKSHLKHILKNPITMSCGHCICKECIPNKSTKKVECAICGERNKHNLKQAKESVIVESVITTNLDNLFYMIQDGFFKVLCDLKSNFIGARERIDLQFEYVKEEIDIKVESLKIDLENIAEKLKNEVETQKLQFMKNFDELELFLHKGKADYECLKNEIQINIHQNEDFLYKYQDKIKELEQLKHNLETLDGKIFLHINEVSIDKSIIGDISYVDPLALSLKNGLFQVVEFKCNTFDSCVLAPNRLLTIASDAYSTESSALCLYDENFQLIKKSEKVDDFPYSISTNGVDKIYVSDSIGNRILVYDFDLNFVKSVGTKGTSNNQFNDPSGICFHKENLFICDKDNRRIQVMNEDLQFLKCHQLTFKPLYISIIESTVCIREHYNPEIAFFDLESFSMKYKYNCLDGVICAAGSQFYEFNGNKKLLCCYNKEGSIDFELELALPNRLTGLSIWTSLVYYQNKFTIIDPVEYVTIS